MLQMYLQPVGIHLPRDSGSERGAAPDRSLRRSHPDGVKLEALVREGVPAYNHQAMKGPIVLYLVR
jgi:hypothetical protein